MKAETMTPTEFSAFYLVEQVDKWPYFQRDPVAYRKHMEDFYYFMVEGCDRPLGYMHHSFLATLLWSPAWEIDKERHFLTLMRGNVKTRTQAINDTLRANFDEKRVLRKWFNESLALLDYSGEHVLDMDRSGVDVFGVITYGVHMTGFVRTESGELKYWVPRRSYTKKTYPGLLDNFVAGNLNIFTEGPLDGIVREVSEETGISEEYTHAHITACGTLTYQMTVTNDDRPACQHHCQYVYEMELLKDVVPHPNDGEVESFELMSLEKVQAALMKGEFTPNRALTYIAHFIRHGIVTAENEPHFVEVCARLHRKHDLFVV